MEGIYGRNKLGRQRAFSKDRTLLIGEGWAVLCGQQRSSVGCPRSKLIPRHQAEGGGQGTTAGIPLLGIRRLRQMGRDPQPELARKKCSSTVLMGQIWKARNHRYDSQSWEAGPRRACELLEVALKVKGKLFIGSPPQLDRGEPH